MFERFDDGARETIIAARDACRALGQPAVGSEHILLGMLREPATSTGTLLRGSGVEPNAVRAEVERRAQESSDRGSVDAHVPRPFTADAKRALELSLREALNLGDHHINELHLALGVLRWDDSAAADVLRALDIDSERVRRVLLETVMPHTAGEPYVPRGLERLAGRMRRRGGEREVEDTVHQLTLQVERLDAQVTRLTEIVERLDRDRPG